MVGEPRAEPGWVDRVDAGWAIREIEAERLAVAVLCNLSDDLPESQGHDREVVTS